ADLHASRVDRPPRRVQLARRQRLDDPIRARGRVARPVPPSRLAVPEDAEALPLRAPPPVRWAGGHAPAEADVAGDGPAPVGAATLPLRAHADGAPVSYAVPPAGAAALALHLRCPELAVAERVGIMRPRATVGAQGEDGRAGGRGEQAANQCRSPPSGRGQVC